MLWYPIQKTNKEGLEKCNKNNKHQLGRDINKIKIIVLFESKMDRTSIIKIYGIQYNYQHTNLLYTYYLQSVKNVPGFASA